MSQTTTSTPLKGTSIDDLTQSQPATNTFLDKHQTKLIVVASILIIVALCYMMNENIKQSEEQSAGELLVTNSDASELEKIIKTHPETAAAGSSKVLLADQQWSENQQDDAIATLRGFIDSSKDHPARPTAMASLATKLHSLGKTPEAEELLKDLTTEPDGQHLAPYAWITLGDIAVKKGDLEAAEKAYSTLEKEFADNTLAQEAIQRRLQMKAASPVEVAAPIELPERKILGVDDGEEKVGEIKDIRDALKTATGGSLPIPLPENDKKDK